MRPRHSGAHGHHDGRAGVAEGRPATRPSVVSIAIRADVELSQCAVPPRASGSPCVRDAVIGALRAFEDFFGTLPYGKSTVDDRSMTWTTLPDRRGFPVVAVEKQDWDMGERAVPRGLGAVQRSGWTATGVHRADGPARAQRSRDVLGRGRRFASASRWEHSPPPPPPPLREGPIEMAEAVEMISNANTTSRRAGTGRGKTSLTRARGPQRDARS